MSTAEINLDNREKILDTAEALFARHGFSATSVRVITAEAGVNLAAVNYYFGSKDNLIIEVLSRVIRPINQQRMQLLDRAIADNPKPTPLEAILEAMIRPCLEMAFDPERQDVSRLLGRSIIEEGNFIQKIIENEWNPVMDRFVTTLQGTLPNLSREEIFWRMHFVIGSVIHVVSHQRDLRLLCQGLGAFEFDSVLKRLITFATAGLQAPSPQLTR